MHDFYGVRSHFFPFLVPELPQREDQPAFTWFPNGETVRPQSDTVGQLSNLEVHNTLSIYLAVWKNDLESLLELLVIVSRFTFPNRYDRPSKVVSHRVRG